VHIQKARFVSPKSQISIFFSQPTAKLYDFGEYANYPKSNKSSERYLLGWLFKQWIIIGFVFLHFLWYVNYFLFKVLL
jgi:hypothetical protein